MMSAVRIIGLVLTLEGILLGFAAGQSCFDWCELEICQNGGTCTNHGMGCVECTCPPEYTGSRCQTEIPCIPACENGDCVGGECVCEILYTGDACETPIGCYPDCGQGTCAFDQCFCPGDYTGTRCETPIACYPDCGPGTCLFENCVCPPEFTGPQCETPIACYPDCGPGTCLLENCVCPPEFTGPQCETPVCTCIYGLCIDDECVCAPGYWGDHCETEIPPGVGYTCDEGALNQACTPQHIVNAWYYFPYHGNCTMYIQCVPGPPIECHEKSCPADLIWNPHEYVCTNPTSEYNCTLTARGKQPTDHAKHPKNQQRIHP